MKSENRIFPPVKENWNVLYVEFGSDKEVDIVFNHTKAITKKDHRVIRWTPKQMFDRFRAVQTMAYNIRKEEGLRTRVKIGINDFLLCTRSPTSPVWHTRSLPNNLPAIDLSQSLSTPVSPPLCHQVQLRSPWGHQSCGWTDISASF